MRDDESHGLLAHHAGCVHERHVEVVSNSQAREVVRRDALVERVVDRAAADFIGEQRRDIAPGVVKLGYGMLFDKLAYVVLLVSAVPDANAALFIKPDSQRRAHNRKL